MTRVEYNYLSSGQVEGEGDGMQFYLDRVKFNGVHSTSSDFSEYTATEVWGHKALRQTIIK